MDTDQNNNLNAEPADNCEAITGSVTTDWEVDRAGNAYSICNKLRENLFDLKDEFKESN